MLHRGLAFLLPYGRYKYNPSPFLDFDAKVSGCVATSYSFPHREPGTAGPRPLPLDMFCMSCLLFLGGFVAPALPPQEDDTQVVLYFMCTASHKGAPRSTAVDHALNAINAGVLCGRWMRPTANGACSSTAFHCKAPEIHGSQPHFKFMVQWARSVVRCGSASVCPRLWCW